MFIKKKVEELGMEWPEQAPKSMANYKTLRCSGKLLFVSGAGPFKNGEPLYVGKVGGDVSLDEAYEAAKITAINLLSMIQYEIGSLEKIKIVKMLGFVNSAADFYEQPKVINGASDILVDLLGEKGKHARSTIGTSILPYNIPVEIELIAEIEE